MTLSLRRSLRKGRPAAMTLAIVAGIACFLLPASGAAQAATAPASSPTLELEPCTPELSGPAPHFATVRCGSLEVWEDQDRKEGRRISLSVVVISGVWSQGDQSPIFELVGGPGAAATEIGDMILLNELYRDRDLVLMDARGTGGSNPLRCTPEGPPDHFQTYLNQVLPTGPIEKCRDELAKKADLSQYNTRNLVADIEDLRRALGHEKVILYGSSYGTRVALEYIRRYPERVEFATILGIAPPGLYSPRHFARNAQVSLDLLLDACEQDAACHGAFPAFRSEMESLFRRIREKPLTLELMNPIRKEKETVTLSYPVFAANFRYVLYSSRLSANLPWMVHEASKENYEPLMSVIVEIAAQFGRMMYLGQYASFDCAEGPPFLDVEAERADAATTWFGETRLRTQLEICAAWPRGKAPDGFHDPVTADVPVLIISGETDPVTPPHFGDEVAKTLPNSRHLILKGASHGSMEGLAYCAVPIMQAYSQKGSFENLDLSCYGRTFTRPPFFLGNETTTARN